MALLVAIILAIFAAFAGICLFLSLKLSQQLLLVEDLIPVIPVHDIASKDIAKLQRIQNYLSVVVSKSPRFSRSVLLLKSLHWLPVRFRIIFKICPITYQVISPKQPP